MSHTPLLHNTSNPTTAGIWRVHTEGGSYIRKILSGSRPPSHPDWHSSSDPRDWRYWRREAHVYEAGLQQVFAPEGVAGPRLLRLLRLEGGDLELHLEDVAGDSGAELGVEALIEVAGRLGRAQGRLAQHPIDRPWLSRGFLADHIASKHIDPAWLQRDDAWAHPLIRETWPQPLRTGLSWLWRHRHALLGAALRAPRTLGHLDCWSHNLIRTPGGFVLIDWSCVGDAALGEDASNLVLEAVLDELIPAEALPELSERALEAYVEGVVASGWGGDRRAVRRGYRAAAVKWCWMGPLHLQRAVEGGHHAYGGEDLDPTAQYRSRGLALLEAVEHARACIEGAG